MFDELSFFSYIIAGFVGFLAVLLAALLARYWASGNKQLLRACSKSPRASLDS